MLYSTVSSNCPDSIQQHVCGRQAVSERYAAGACSGAQRMHLAAALGMDGCAVRDQVSVAWC